MAFNHFAPQYPYELPINGCFIVENIITNSNKTIRIFDYPVPVGTTRDLLRIPGVSEESIRASLLKGELRNKLRAQEIRVICSDVDLLQFNDTQKTFLMQAGITEGLEVTAIGSGITESQHETLRQLIHLADGTGGGGMEGFDNSYREILPLNDPFPTSIIWYSDISKSFKIVEKNLSYDGNKRITVIAWKVYDTGGLLLATVTDTISYSGSSPFESTRLRAVS
jgi:hypothetical protein